MMADGKWIPGLEAETPVAEAAHHVLAVRLEVVRQRLPFALYEADHDPEHVHQLRVATRRADAALRIFRDCLPRRVYKDARQRLRGLRRAAGAARDWDVFLDELRARKAKSAERPGLDLLTGYALGERSAAQEVLLATGKQEGQEFVTFVDETVAAVRPPADVVGNGSLLDRARPLLAGLLRGLEQTAAADTTDYEKLHQVRIAGKRLRYALEVFAGCFPASFTESLYPQVEQMQEILGRANDSHVAGELLAELRERLRRTQPAAWPRWQAGVEALLRSHQRRLPQQRRRFLRLWEQWKREETLSLCEVVVGAPENGVG
jgi:CHAD domain-containing protein